MDKMSEMVRASRIWRQVALPASIILNLFFAGLVGAHLLHGSARDIHPENPLARALANAEASLPPRDAAAFADVIRREAPHYAAAGRQLQTARQQLGERITAEPFDPDGVRQALAAWRKAWDDFFDAFSIPLVDALDQVSPQGRRKLTAARRAERTGSPPP